MASRPRRAKRYGQPKHVANMPTATATTEDTRSKLIQITRTTSRRARSISSIVVRSRMGCSDTPTEPLNLRQTARPTTEHQRGCSGEPGPEPTEPIGRPLGVVPTPTRPEEPPRAAADGAFSASVPRLSVEAAGGTGWSKRSQPFDVAPGAPARPPALPSFDVAPGAPARPPALPDEGAVPELAAPLDAPPPAPPAPPPCVRAGCEAHVMRATSNKESFFVAMIRSFAPRENNPPRSIRFPLRKRGNTAGRPSREFRCV